MDDYTCSVYFCANPLPPIGPKPPNPPNKHPLPQKNSEAFIYIINLFRRNILVISKITDNNNKKKKQDQKKKNKTKKPPKKQTGHICKNYSNIP